MAMWSMNSMVSKLRRVDIHFDMNFDKDFIPRLLKAAEDGLTAAYDTVYKPLLSVFKTNKREDLVTISVASLVVYTLMMIFGGLAALQFTPSEEIPGLVFTLPDTIWVQAPGFVLKHGFYHVHQALLQGFGPVGRGCYAGVRLVDNFFFPPLYVSLLLSLNSKMELDLGKDLYLPDHVSCIFFLSHVNRVEVTDVCVLP